LIGTIVAAGIAGSADANADSVAEQIRVENERNDQPTDPGFTGSRAPCGDPGLDNPASADVAHYTNACSSLRDDLSRRKSALIAMGVMIGVTVIGAAGTVAFYFIESGDGGTAKSERGPSFSLAPIISPEEQGIGVVGSF
jgi:hypothetical protein